MTIYKKPDLKIFGSKAKPTEIAEFEDLLRGWGITIDKTNGIPPMEWFNYLFNRLDGNVNYILQNGITEYDANLEYPQNAVVKSGGKLYLCLRQNTNKPLSNGAYWELLIKNATTSQSGIVQLSSSVTSTDETKASTPKATKAAYDKATQADNNANSRVSKNGDVMNGRYNINSTELVPLNITSSSNKLCGLNLRLNNEDGIGIAYDKEFDAGRIYNFSNQTVVKIPTESGTICLRSDGVLVGSIQAFASDKTKQGYLKCDGGLYSTTTYAELFKEIGYTWGGSGSRFAVPNLTDKARFLRSSGNGSRVGAYQNDAIRDIRGRLFGGEDYGHQFLGDDVTGSGCFKVLGKGSKKGIGGYGEGLGCRELHFTASGYVPTADENRPYACVVAYWIKY